MYQYHTSAKLTFGGGGIFEGTKSSRGRQKASGAQKAYKKNRKIVATVLFYFLGDSKNFVLCRSAKNFSRRRRIVNMVNVTPLPIGGAFW